MLLQQKATTKVMLANEHFQQTKKCKRIQFGSTENRTSGCQGNDTWRPLKPAQLKKKGHV
jgi:hypothetical protein